MAELYSGLHVGQRFASLEDFKNVIRSISVRQHWDLRVVRSNKKSVVLGCRSSANCYFRVVCRANKNATYITSLQDSHSCRRTATSPGATPARSEASHVRFLLSEIPKLFDMNNKIRGQEVVDAVKRYHGYDISMRQAQRALTKLQPRRPRIHPDRAAQGEGGDEIHASGQPQANHQDGSGYSDIGENRWLHNQLPPSLPPESSVQPNSTQNNQTVSQQSDNQQIPVHPLGQPQDHRNSDQHLPPLHNSQNTYTNPQPTHAVLRPPDPKLQNQQQQQHQSGHPAAPQLVLTNFKIEFTCTTCGALNQSFFPNHGSIVGGNYMQHSSTQNNIQSHPPTSVSHRRSSSTNDGTVNQFDGNAVGHNRDMPSTWTASGLEIPITSANP